AGVRGGERVGGVGEAHDVGRRVVDEPRAPDTRAVHDFEQGVRILHDLDHPVALGLFVAPHYREHLWLELAPRLDVDVDVGDTERAQGRWVRARHSSPKAKRSAASRAAALSPLNTPAYCLSVRCASPAAATRPCSARSNTALRLSPVCFRNRSAAASASAETLTAIFRRLVILK